MILNIPYPIFTSLMMGILVVGVGIASLVYFRYEDSHEVKYNN